MLGEHLRDGGLVGLAAGGGEGERDRPEAEFEQPVSGPSITSRTSFTPLLIALN
ncbi:MAG: hypothetical protein ACEQR8_07260 [Cypionkella sp.]